MSALPAESQRVCANGRTRYFRDEKRQPFDPHEPSMRLDAEHAARYRVPAGMTSRQVARSGNRMSVTTWLGLLALVLHALSPLVGTVAYAPAPLAASSHAGHHHSHAGAGAQEAPAAPHKACDGDCPCCAVGKIQLVAINTGAILQGVPLWSVGETPADRPEPLTGFDPKFHASPRAPPAFS